MWRHARGVGQIGEGSSRATSSCRSGRCAAALRDGGVRLSGRAAARLAAKLVRVAARHPRLGGALPGDRAGSAGPGRFVRPADGYDKKTIVGDIWRLVHDVLGLDEFYLVGHDWGGPVAYAVAAAHPEAVRKLAVLDVTIPGDGSPNISQGGRRWHHAFHQTLDLPEALVAGREDIYLGWFYRNYGARPDAIPEADIAEYLRVYRQPGALRAGFSYYRAIPQDIADNSATAARFKLPMPVLALGGDRSWGRRMEVVESLRRLAMNVQGGMVENCGHWMPEEQPIGIAAAVTGFLRS